MARGSEGSAAGLQVGFGRRELAALLKFLPYLALPASERLSVSQGNSTRGSAVGNFWGSLWSPAHGFPSKSWVTWSRPRDVIPRKLQGSFQLWGLVLL